MPPAYVSFIFFILLFALSLSGIQVFADPDTAWHLATGDLIRSQQFIPLSDSWSFTANAQHWNNPSWLADILFSILFAKGGFAALYALTLFAFAGSAAFMAYHSVRRGAGILEVFFIVCIIILPILRTCAYACPMLLSLPFTVLFYHLLHSYYTTHRWQKLLLLPVLMVAWANLHGGYMLVLPIIGCFVLQAIWERDRKCFLAYSITLISCFCASLVNPDGINVYFITLKAFSSSFAQEYIYEWKSVDLSHNWPMAILLFAMLFLGNPFDKGRSRAEGIVAIVMLLLALKSVRNSSLAAVLLIPYLSLRLTTVLQNSGWGKSIRNRDAAMLRDMVKPEIRYMVFAILTAFSFICIWPYNMVSADALQFPKEKFPSEEAVYIEEHYPQVRFLNDYNIGGYLAYIWRGRIKLFIDGRSNSAYGEDLLNDYRTFIESRGYGPDSARIIKQYRIEGLVLANILADSGFWQYNPDWHAVHRGKVATVYLKTTADAQ